ncbi:MAG: chemotaxis protein CheX [Deltaproteobacteria bacterium]|nr:chemotaxis protein CheX [Deltaproteobacteria bacterium]
MASFQPVPGKPYVKKDDLAHGDVSGIIGITGDAIGSLAISFSESCICNVVGRMLGETYTTINHDVLDAVGELTNMISGVSRTQLEKKGMTVFAAIPSVVFGSNHTITHILKSPSIVIPFTSPSGPFFVDVCIRTANEPEKKSSSYGVVNKPTLAGENTPPPAPAVANSDNQEPLDRLELLKKKLSELLKARTSMQNELAEKPFMEMARRKLFKKNIPLLDVRIKRLKLDITTTEMLQKMTKDELENPKIVAHYQHYDPKETRNK